MVKSVRSIATRPAGEHSGSVEEKPFLMRRVHFMNIEAHSRDKINKNAVHLFFHTTIILQFFSAVHFLSPFPGFLDPSQRVSSFCACSLLLLLLLTCRAPEKYLARS